MQLNFPGSISVRQAITTWKQQIGFEGCCLNEIIRRDRPKSAGISENSLFGGFAGKIA